MAIHEHSGRHALGSKTPTCPERFNFSSHAANAAEWNSLSEDIAEQQMFA
jgi:hypothetical protein